MSALEGRRHGEEVKPCLVALRKIMLTLTLYMGWKIVKTTELFSPMKMHREVQKTDKNGIMQVETEVDDLTITHRPSLSLLRGLYGADSSLRAG